MRLWWRRTPSRGFAPCSRTGPCVLRTPPGSRIPGRRNNSRRWQARVPLSTQRLPLRKYRLTAAVIRGPNRHRHPRVSHDLADMPRSLRNVEEAIGSLRYVATEATMDVLLDRSLEKPVANLENFWKPRDRSPETAPNEVMTDITARRPHQGGLGPSAWPDGFLTDRGRITCSTALPPAPNGPWTPRRIPGSVEYAARTQSFVFR